SLNEIISYARNKKVAAERIINSKAP
ncbi:hypothetical protein HKBW3S03_02166, partial [Candidatus Hakubella thermalkaliphila]